MLNKKKDKVFYIYKLYFDTSDKVYIGKTYDIAHRISDHLRDVNTGKRTPKCNWLRKHLKLSELKYDILYSCDDELEAYKKELELIRFFMNDTPIVNCQRVKEAGGVSKRRTISDEALMTMRNTFSKEYVVINKAGIVTNVLNLKLYAEENGLMYKGLNSCARGKTKVSQGLCVICRSYWDSLTYDKKCNKIEEIKNHSPYANQDYKLTLRKDYWILHPDGSIEKIWGLSSVCRERGYNEGSVFNTIKDPNKFYKGIKLFKSEQELLIFKNNKDND